MDVDCAPSSLGADQRCQQPRTDFQRCSSQHLCDHRCHVEHMFGNVFQCRTSGLLHVCDATCACRVFRDAHSSICLLSRRVHPPLDGTAPIRCVCVVQQEQVLGP
jgi:hypothetical protein